MWRAEAGDIGKEFTQHMKILLPDDTEFGFGTEKFKMEKAAHSIQMRVQGFPIGIEGDVVVKIWLEVGTQKVTKITNYLINVLHVKPGSKK